MSSNTASILSGHYSLDLEATEFMDCRKKKHQPRSRRALALYILGRSKKLLPIPRSPNDWSSLVTLPSFKVSPSSDISRYDPALKANTCFQDSNEIVYQIGHIRSGRDNSRPDSKTHNRAGFTSYSTSPTSSTLSTVVSSLKPNQPK